MLDDTFTVLDGVVVVVLELGVDPQHRQPDAADTCQHPPIRRGVDGYGGVAAFGLEVGELGGEDLDFALRVAQVTRTSDGPERRAPVASPP